jgi:hypothetical protein
LNDRLVGAPHFLARDHPRGGQARQHLFRHLAHFARVGHGQGQVGVRPGSMPKKARKSASLTQHQVGGNQFGAGIQPGSDGEGIGLSIVIAQRQHIAGRQAPGAGQRRPSRTAPAGADRSFGHLHGEIGGHRRVEVITPQAARKPRARRADRAAAPASPPAPDHGGRR